MYNLTGRRKNVIFMSQFTLLTFEMTNNLNFSYYYRTIGQNKQNIGVNIYSGSTIRGLTI